MNSSESLFEESRIVFFLRSSLRHPLLPLHSPSSTIISTTRCRNSDKEGPARVTGVGRRRKPRPIKGFTWFPAVPVHRGGSRWEGNGDRTGSPRGRVRGTRVGSARSPRLSTRARRMGPLVPPQGSRPALVVAAVVVLLVLTPRRVRGVPREP